MDNDKQTISIQSSDSQAHKKSALDFPSNTKIVHTQAPVYAGLLVGGIIVGVLLATAWSSLEEDNAPGTATTSAQTIETAQPIDPPPGTTAHTDPPVVVQDQPAGSSVTIKSLSIAKPTWVVVYVSREGKPGNALGARLFFAGDRKGSVGLLRNTEPGQSYFVGLSVDNGDKVFSLQKDLPLADADGGPLWAVFRAR